MNKKGVVFVFVAIIFIIVFIALFTTMNRYQYQDRAEIHISRIETMNGFIKDLGQDLDRAAFISGFRSLIAMEEHLSVTGEFFTNVTEMEDAFRELFVNGSINGSAMSILENSTFSEYLSRVSLQAELVGLSVELNVSNVTLYQENPWIVTIGLYGVFNVSDDRDLAWWSYNKSFETAVPIYYLKDPLYTVKTIGRVPNTVRNYSVPVEWLVNDTNGDVSYMSVFINKSYYRESSRAPNFLMRFTNNLSADTNGIESVVNLPLISDQGLSVLTDRSVIDYLYFSSAPNNNSDFCTIENLVFSPDWFRLDENHYYDYEMDVLTYINCT